MQPLENLDEAAGQVESLKSALSEARRMYDYYTKQADVELRKMDAIGVAVAVIQSRVDEMIAR